MAEDAKRTAHPSLPRVVYIMGSGRSGSTVLDATLGNHPQIQGVGELYTLLRQGWLNSQSCACGRRADECAFWTEVRRLWTEKTGLKDPDAHARALRRFETRRWSMLDLVRQRGRPGPALREYLACTRALYEAIGSVSGKPVVVDSSKNPTRAYAISMISGVDLRVIQLVRDVRGVAWSQMKTIKKDGTPGATHDLPGRPAWRTALGWAVTNSRADGVRRRLGPERCCFLRYEDYVADPPAALAWIGRTIDLDLTALANAVESSQPMQIGHTIAGNRLRMAGSVKLRADLEWIDKMSGWNRRLCWLLAGWKMRQYGYTRNAVPRACVPGRLGSPVAAPHTAFNARQGAESSPKA